MATPTSPTLALRGLLAWTAVTTLMFWLPTIRGPFDGSTYSWGLASFRGTGVRGDYWYPLLGVGFALTLQVLGWRRARPPFHYLLVGWHLLLLAAVIDAVLTDPAGFRFQGDSLGIDISLVWIGPALFGIPALLALRWAWTDLRTGHTAVVPPWGPRNTRWTVALLLLLPLQFGLLRSGAPGSAMDAVGVLLTIVQWLLIGQALRPYPSASAA